MAGRVSWHFRGWGFLLGWIPAERRRVLAGRRPGQGAGVAEVDGAVPSIAV